jgi:uncharacterized protein with HEPN domain
MKSDDVFLRHILDELDFLLKRTGGIDFDEFAADDVLRRACARSLLPLKGQVEELLRQEGRGSAK